MARFYGEIGYADSSEETSPGVWVEQIVEYTYHGEIVRNARRLQEGDNLNTDLVSDNSIRVVADAYAYEHFHAIRYIRWAGTLWTVTNVEVQRPRLLLRLGGVYNGPTGGPPESP
jgi:hypothetical protein